MLTHAPPRAQVDADALWRAIDAARHAGCREEALQVAEKKLADITTPSWWQRAAEPAPVESSQQPGECLSCGA